MFVRFAAVVVCAMLAARALAAEQAFSNAKDAGPDYAVQGEYKGEAGDHVWGAQVVALGDGKFDVAGFRGGLPGDGWKRGDQIRQGKGETKDGTVQVQGDTWTGTIKDGVFTVMQDGATIGELKK